MECSYVVYAQIIDITYLYPASSVLKNLQLIAR